MVVTTRHPEVKRSELLRSPPLATTFYCHQSVGSRLEPNSSSYSPVVSNYTLTTGLTLSLPQNTARQRSRMANYIYLTPDSLEVHEILVNALTQQSVSSLLGLIKIKHAIDIDSWPQLYKVNSIFSCGILCDSNATKAR